MPKAASTESVVTGLESYMRDELSVESGLEGGVVVARVNDLSGNEVFEGVTPVKALGVTDQHSQVQLYAEG